MEYASFMSWCHFSLACLFCESGIFFFFFFRAEKYTVFFGWLFSYKKSGNREMKHGCFHFLLTRHSNMMCWLHCLPSRNVARTCANTCLAGIHPLPVRLWSLQCVVNPADMLNRQSDWHLASVAAANSGDDQNRLKTKWRSADYMWQPSLKGSDVKVVQIVKECRCDVCWCVEPWMRADRPDRMLLAYIRRIFTDLSYQ